MKTIYKYLLFIFLSSILIGLPSCKSLTSGPNNPQPEDGLYSINLDGTNQKELASGGIGAFSFANDDIIYGYFYSINVDGTNPHTLVPNNLLPSSFSVSPDGTKIIFSTSSRDVYIVNYDGSGLSKINIPDTAIKYYPNLSYDNNKITYGNSNGIYQIDISGDNFKKLRGINAKGIRFLLTTYTPNDKIIYSDYNDSTGMFQSLHLIDPQSLNDTVLLLLGNSFGRYFEISNSGSILFTDNTSIHEFDLNNMSDKIITQGIDAHFSIDFSKISYVDPDGSEIDLLNLETDGQLKIKPSSLESYNFSEPKISPDGTKIIFIGISAEK